MKRLLKITLFLCCANCFSQAKLELTPNGFVALEMKSPHKSLDKLLEISNTWASYYNKKGYDVFDVNENSLTIQARIENGYYSYNEGVKYNCDIVYTLKIKFDENQKYTLKISIKEIYAENVLLKTNTTDFFTTDGKLKDDFSDAKPSLENTINRIVNSYTKFISQ